MESLEDRIKRFLRGGFGDGGGFGRGDGSGDGCGFSFGFGFGFGSGCGGGDGDGCGFSFGFGSGCGGGDGSGCGSGDGDGCGCGDGDGSGFGSGCGSGDGSGYSFGDGGGLKSYNRQQVYYIDCTPTLINSIHNNVAKGYIINANKTLSACFVVRIGNSFAHGETLKAAHADALSKHMLDMPEDERIEMFVNEHPAYDKAYPCQDLFKWHNILTGSCEMGRRSFCKNHGIDLNSTYTVRYFLGITKDAYGGNIIKKVIEKYENQLL